MHRRSVLSRLPAYKQILHEMARAEAADELDDAELVCEGLLCFLGERRVSLRSVKKLLQLVAIREDSYSESVHRYTLNDVGRALVRRPELEGEVREALLRGVNFTVKDDRLVELREDGTFPW
jgi:hypothetical protein